MAHSTTTVEEFPEPGSELAISVGAIAEKLLQTIRDKGDRTDSDQRGLLERALAVATEAEQRLVEQSRRIALLEMLTLTDEVTSLMNQHDVVDENPMYVFKADTKYKENIEYEVWLELLKRQDKQDKRIMSKLMNRRIGKMPRG